MEIKGKVVSPKGTPIENATVMIVQGPFQWQDMAAMTNENGEFSLEVRGRGDYQLEIQANNKSQKVYLKPSPNIQKIVFQ